MAECIIKKVKKIHPPPFTFTVRFGHLVIYLHKIQMHPVMVQIVHVPYDWKCPRSWREVGWPTVSDKVCSQDENSSEEQQCADAPVCMGRKYRSGQAHSSYSWLRGSIWLRKADTILMNLLSD